MLYYKSYGFAGQGKLGALLEQANHQFAGAMQHSIPYQLLQEAAGDRAASLPFLTMNADLEMTKSALTLKSIKATPLDAQRFAGLYAKSAMIAYRRVLLFFRANQDDGLTGGLAWNPEFLDQAQGESIVSKLKVGTSALKVLSRLAKPTFLKHCRYNERHVDMVPYLPKLAACHSFAVK